MASDILIVDDEADIRELVAGILQDEGHGTRTARDSDDALAQVVARRPNLVFLDIWLQGSRLDGLQLLDALKQEHPELPIVMISGHGNIETAVSAIKRGAYDFIEKPFKADRLLLVADRALENSRLRREVRDLKQLAPIVTVLVGRSPAANQLRQTVDKVAPTNSRVLVIGPSRQRQGTRRAYHPLAFGPRQCAVRRHQRRRHHARAHGSRIVRRRRRKRHAEPQDRRARRGPWRHAVHRRNRRHAARDAEQDHARLGRADLPARRRQQQGVGRRAHRVVDQPQHRIRHRRRKVSARTSITACPSCRSACRRSPSVARIFRNSSNIS